VWRGSLFDPVLSLLFMEIDKVIEERKKSLLKRFKELAVHIKKIKLYKLTDSITYQELQEEYDKIKLQLKELIFYEKG